MEVAEKKHADLRETWMETGVHDRKQGLGLT